MNKVSFGGEWSVRRAYLVGRNTFLEAVRLKLFYALMLMSLFALGSSFLLKEFNFGSSELKFIADFGFGGLTFFGSVMAVVLTAQLFFGELEHRTAITLLAKPMRRSEFIVGKFLGVGLGLFCFVAAILSSLVLALWVRETSLAALYPESFGDGFGIRYFDLLGFGILQVIRLAMLSSLVMLFASYATSSLFSIVMGMMVWLIGQLQYLASSSIGQIESAFVGGLLKVLSLMIPNFHLFDLGDRIALGEVIVAADFLWIAAYGSLYSLFYISLAALSFRYREL